MHQQSVHRGDHRAKKRKTICKLNCVLAVGLVAVVVATVRLRIHVNISRMVEPVVVGLEFIGHCHEKIK